MNRLLSGDAEQGQIHKRDSGQCNIQLGSSSACTKSAAEARVRGMIDRTYASELGAMPLKEASVLAAWGSSGSACIQQFQRMVTSEISVPWCSWRRHA